MFSRLLIFAPVQVFSSISAFLLISLHTQFLTIEEYGLLALLMVVIEVCRAIMSQWVNVSLLRLYPAAADHEKQYFSASGLKLIYCLFVPAVGCLLVFSGFYGTYDNLTLVVLSLLLIVKSTYLYMIDMARLKERVSTYRRAVVTQACLALIISIIGLNYEASITSAIISLIMSYLLAMVWLRSIADVTVMKWSAITSLVKYGLPIMLAGAVNTLLTKVDRFFIADFLDLSETGAYSAITGMLLGITTLVFMTVAMPLYPDLARLTKQPDKLKVAHGKYLDLLLATVLPAIIGLCFVAEPVTRVFLSAEYSNRIDDVFYLIALSVFLFNLKNHYVDHGLQFLLQTHYMTLVSVLMLALNIILLILLLEPLGISGAAWASVTVNFCALICTGVIAFKKGYRYSVGPDFWKVLGASLIMTMFLLTVSYLLQFQPDNDLIYLVLLIPVGILSYSLSLLCSDCFGIQQKLGSRFAR